MIALNLLRLAKKAPDLLESYQDNISEFIESDGGGKDHAIATYRLNSTDHQHPIVFDSDWADAKFVQSLAYNIENLTDDGKRFRTKDNGQAVVVMYLSDTQASALGALLKEKIHFL